MVFSTGIDPDIVKYQLVRNLKPLALGQPVASVEHSSRLSESAALGSMDVDSDSRATLKKRAKESVASEESWIRGETFHRHSHDVKGLCVAGDRLISGGILSNYYLLAF